MIGPRRPSAVGVIWTEIFADDFVCVVWRDHPVKRLTKSRYLELPHVLVAPTGRPGGLVDHILAAQGLRRRVALRTPAFLSVPGALVGGPCITTLPRRIAELFASRCTVTTRPTSGFGSACSLEGPLAFWGRFVTP